MVSLCFSIAAGQADKFSAEYLTGWGTIALAIITLVLAVFASRQLKDAKDFIHRYTRVTEDQSSENTIIKQIEFHHKILDRMDSFSINGQQMTFRDMYQLLDGLYKTGKNQNTPVEEQIKSAFGALYKYTYGILGNYYKNLYYLVKYIHDLGKNHPKKEYYVNLVEAQLSKYEILLLFYDCIWLTDQPIGQNFIDYAIGLNLLTSLEQDELIMPHTAILDRLKQEYSRDKKITSLLYIGTFNTAMRGSGHFYSSLQISIHEAQYIGKWRDASGEIMSLNDLTINTTTNDIVFKALSSTDNLKEGMYKGKFFFNNGKITINFNDIILKNEKW